jgi:hypothetical protein
MKIRLVLSVAVVLGCNADAPSTGSVSQSTIIDQLHGGGAGFFWLPPMVPPPPAHGDVVADSNPTVEIDRIDDPTHGSVLQHVATYTRTSGPFGEQIRLKRVGVPADDTDGDTDPDGFFVVRFDSDHFTLDPTAVYRVRVYVPGAPSASRGRSASPISTSSRRRRSSRRSTATTSCR